MTAMRIPAEGRDWRMNMKSTKPAENSTTSVEPNRKKAPRKKAAGRGASLLSEAADKTLEENSCEIAKSLLDSTLKGNVHSARLLVALAEGPAENEKPPAKRRSRSQARQLAAEPTWKSETAAHTSEDSSRQTNQLNRLESGPESEEEQ